MASSKLDMEDALLLKPDVPTDKQKAVKDKEDGTSVEEEEEMKSLKELNIPHFQSVFLDGSKQTGTPLAMEEPLRRLDINVRLHSVYGEW